MKYLLSLVAFIAATTASASHLEDHSAKALHYFGKCAPALNLSCMLTGTCEATACAKCEALDAIESTACPEKPYAYAALEGLMNVTEGYCSKVCSVGSPVSPTRVKDGSKAGSDATVLMNYNDKGQGLALTFKNGMASLSDLSYDGPKHAPGTQLSLPQAAVSQPISQALSCVNGTTSAPLKACFTNPKSCRTGMAKGNKCAVCTALKSCDENAQVAFNSLFGQQNFCAGCP